MRYLCLSSAAIAFHLLSFANVGAQAQLCTSAPVVPTGIDASSCASTVNATAGATCTVSCANGMFGTPVEYACTVNNGTATWTGQPPSCKSFVLCSEGGDPATCVDCPPLDVAAEAPHVDTRSCGAMKAGSECRVQCKQGFGAYWPVTPYKCTIDKSTGKGVWDGWYQDCKPKELAKIDPMTPWINKAWCPQTNDHDGDMCARTTPRKYKMDDKNTTYWILVDYFVDDEVVKDLHAAGNKVICYMDGGTLEPFRDDAASFDSELLGTAMKDWDEIWFDIRDTNPKHSRLQYLMKERMRELANKGCDAIEIDNVDCWSNDCIPDVESGTPEMFQHQLKYNKWLAQTAHDLTLAVGLKNDMSQIKELVDHFDFAINENCHTYDECSSYDPFVKAGKAVLGAEYEFRSAKSVCESSYSSKLTFITADSYDWDPCPLQKEAIDTMTDYANMPAAATPSSSSPAALPSQWMITLLSVTYILSSMWV